MSTYFGGEQLVAFKTFSGATTSDQTIQIYTVPNGRYAEIELIYLDVDNGLEVVTELNEVPSERRRFPLLNETQAIESNPKTTMHNGESIRSGSAGAGFDYYFQVKEYALP